MYISATIAALNRCSMICIVVVSV